MIARNEGCNGEMDEIESYCNQIVFDIDGSTHFPRRYA